jgi:hypothetical protein
VRSLFDGTPGCGMLSGPDFWIQTDKPRNPDGQLMLFKSVG